MYQSTFGPPGIIALATRINHKENAAKYETDEVSIIKDRIKKAAKTHDVTVGK